jgi:hypothetical protein
VRFEVFTQIEGYVLVFWFMTPCSLVERFIMMNYNHLQEGNIRKGLRWGIQNFSFGGGGGADHEAIYKSSLILKIML